MIIKTERLILRPFRESDFDAVHAYMSDRETLRYLNFGPNNEDQTRIFISAAIHNAHKKPRRCYDFAVTLKSSSALIGAFSMRLLDIPQSASVGYIFNKNYSNMGYASEAACAVLSFGFETLGLHRITGECNAENAASARVMEKAGMLLEGRLIKARYGRVCNEERWFDLLMYAKLSDE